jgi:hypothetical protein
MGWIAPALMSLAMLSLPASGLPQSGTPEPVVVTYGFSGTQGRVLLLTWDAPAIPEADHEAVRAEVFENIWVTGVTMDETSLRIGVSAGPKPAEMLKALTGILERRLSPGSGIRLRMAGVYYKGGPRKAG